MYCQNKKTIFIMGDAAWSECGLGMLCAQDQAINGHGMIFDFPCISLQIKVCDLLIEA